MKNYTAEFEASYPWERWLELVFTTDLKEIKEIGCGGVDGDEILVGFRDSIRE